MTTSPRPSPLHAPAGGFSLVELLVALLLGIIVTGAVVNVVVRANNAHAELTNFSRQVENGRFAMNLLGDEIRHAGYFSRVNLLPDAPGTLPDPCSLSPAAMRAALGLHVQGYASDPSLSCLPSANIAPGSDILVVRRVTSAFTQDLAELQNGRVYMQVQPLLFRFDSAPPNVTEPFDLTEQISPTELSPIHRFRTDIYYVAPCTLAGGATSCNGSDDSIPTLMRLRLVSDGTNPTWRNEALVEGIEQLRYDFGIDDNGDGIPNRYIALPASTAEWQNVMTVRVNMLVRSVESSVDYEDQKQYVLGTAGTVGPFDDAFRRRLFSATVQIVNPSGRREG